jgi:tetratricopeptide (TPR) repeat protein
MSNNKSQIDGQIKLTVDEAYKQALDHFNGSRYTEADQLCTAIMQAAPNHIDAINLLGVVAQKVNRHDLAIELFQRAINIDNSRALLYYNFGTSLYTLGRRDEAIRVLEISLEMEPGNSQIIDYLKGIKANVESTSEISTPQNKEQEFWQRGIACHRTGRISEAIHWYRKTLEINPNNTVALTNMGAALQTTGKMEEAVHSYQKAISIKPDLAEVHSNLGNILKEQGKLKEAVHSYQKAINIKPNLAEAHYNLGIALQRQKKLKEAVHSYQKAITIKPDYADAHSNLGNILKEQGKLKEAITSYQKAITIKPDYADAHSNIGIALKEQGKLDEAVASYQKAIIIKPDYADAHSNLGNALEEQDKLKEAATSYQKATSLRLNHDASKAVPVDFPGINSVFIELTNRCNFHCSFCPSDDQTRTIGEMPLSLVKKIFHEISSRKLTHTVNLHHMGEPTLFRHLREVLQLAAQYGLKVDLVTNGSTLKKGKIELLLNELSGILSLSLQTPTMDSFKLRGTKMLWDDYITSIKDLITTYVSRVAKGGSLQCTVSIRLMKTDSKWANVDVLSEKESVVSQINYWSDFIGSIEHQEGVTPYPRKQPNLLLDEWFAKRNSTYILHPGIKLVFWSNFTFANTVINEDAQLKCLDNTKFCFHPFSEISILWDGRCVPCCLDYDGQLDVGNANIDSLESILMGEKASQLRKAFLGDGSLPKYCQKCQSEIV